MRTGISFRPMPWLTVLSLIAVTILIALGNWQVRRHEWKTQLIDAIERRSSQDPVPLQQLLVPAGSLEDIHFANTTITGRFVGDQDAYIFTSQGALGVGYFVLSPFQLDDGSHVLVNRGFVPEKVKEADLHKFAKTGDEKTITGIIRLPDPDNRYIPDFDPVSRTWYDRDLDGMAENLGIGKVLPVFVDADDSPNPNGWPKGGMTKLTFANNHLGYAWTWYGLALALLGVYIAYHIKLGRLTWGQGRKL